MQLVLNTSSIYEQLTVYSQESFYIYYDSFIVCSGKRSNSKRWYLYKSKNSTCLYMLKIKVTKIYINTKDNKMTKYNMVNKLNKINTKMIMFIDTINTKFTIVTILTIITIF